MKATFITFALCLMFSFQSFSQTKWEYPKKLGTQEWKALTTHKEMLAVCQIPEEVLTSLKTIELLDINLENPLLSDCYAYSSIPEGMGKFFCRFNGFREMIAREDIASIIHEKQASFLTDIINGSDDEYAQGEKEAMFTILDYILANRTVSGYVSEEEIKTCSKVAFQHMYALLKTNLTLNIESSAYLLCTYLDKESDETKKSPLLAEFLISGTLGRNRTNIIKELVTIYSKTIQ